MFKKIISVVLALCIALGCFTVIAGARRVEVGGGAESFNPVVFSQESDAIGSTRVGTNLVARITDRNYKVEINTISADILYLETGDTSKVFVTYEIGTVIDDVTKFPVTGEINASTNSAVRYTVNYDILDAEGNTVWKNLTGYTYGVVSGSEAVTGAIGTYPDNPGDIHAGARFTSIDKLNSCYVQVSSAALLYTLKTQHFFITFRQRRTEISVVEGNAPSTLRMYPVDWPSVQWYRQESEGTWLMWSTPESNYYNFTLDMNSNNEDWDDESNTVVSTEMYYLDDWDRTNARTISERVLGINGRFDDGFYVQKGKYTEESWNNFLKALDMANHVMLAVPGANYGFKVACQNGARADDNLTIAFDGLLEAPCDWTSYKDPIVGEQSTCGSGGTMIYTCICGRTKIEATGTSGCNPADEWTVTLEPTCTSKGEEAQLCTMCSSPVNVRDIDPLGHEYEAIIVEPECEEQGYTAYTCIRGDHVYYDDYVEPAGHSPAEAVKENEIPATCLRMGRYENAVYCSDCDKELSRSMVRTDKAPHTPGKWVVQTQPTINSKGEEWLYCSVCGYEYERREIPKLEPYFRAAKGSETIVDEERGIIYGLPEYLTDLEGYVEYDGGTVEYIETENGFGTGTIVNFIVNGEVRNTYSIVIYGDLTGDGMINEDDLAVYEALINFDIEFEEGTAFKYASDLFFGEGVADTYDLAHFYSVLSGEGLIFQNPAADELTIIDKSLTGNVSVMTVLSDDEVAQGDTITVTVKLTSSDYISNIQIPVLFDKTQFEIVGDATNSDFLSFAENSPLGCRNYTLNGSADKSVGFSMTSDDEKWNTEEMKNKYGYAYITATYNADEGMTYKTYAKPVDPNGNFVEFQLKALTDVENATESVFVDADWAKTADNVDGLLVAGLKKAETYDPYEPVVPYENVTFIIPSTVSESKQHIPSDKIIENNVNATCTTDGSYDEVVYCTECDEELSRNTVVVPSLGHTEADPVKENEIPASGSEKASYDKVVYCSVCGEEISREKIVIDGVKVSGTVKSFDDEIDNSDVITFEFFVNGQTEPVYTFTAEGSGVVEYEFDDINPGTYTVKVSKASHATRTYTVYVHENGLEAFKFEIQLLGDVTGDGKVNTVDVARINAHARHISTIVGYSMLCADINGDGKINTVDVARVNAHAKKIASVW